MAGTLVSAFVVGAAACSSGATTGAPTRTVTAAPAAAASEPAGALLEAKVVGDADHPGYTVDAPDDWSVLDGAFVLKDGAGVLGVSVWDVGTVPGHPCRWKGTERDAGSSVADLVELLAAQPLRDATDPIDVTLAGYDGRYLELSVPDDWVVTGDANFEGCDDPGNGHNDFVSWWGEDAGERYQQVAGQVDRLWVLDVDGQRLVVDATYGPDVSAEDLEELEQVVASLRFVEDR